MVMAERAVRRAGLALDVGIIVVVMFVDLHRQLGKLQCC